MDVLEGGHYMIKAENCKIGLSLREMLIPRNDVVDIKRMFNFRQKKAFFHKVLCFFFDYFLFDFSNLNVKYVFYKDKEVSFRHS